MPSKGLVMPYPILKIKDIDKRLANTKQRATRVDGALNLLLRD